MSDSKELDEYGLIKKLAKTEEPKTGWTVAPAEEDIVQFIPLTIDELKVKNIDAGVWAMSIFGKSAVEPTEEDIDDTARSDKWFRDVPRIVEEAIEDSGWRAAELKGQDDVQTLADLSSFAEYQKQRKNAPVLSRQQEKVKNFAKNFGTNQQRIGSQLREALLNYDLRTEAWKEEDIHKIQRTLRESAGIEYTLDELRAHFVRRKNQP